jgi:hypothetical protein
MIDFSRISILPVLLLYYISLGGNRMMPHQMQQLLDTNDYVYHLFNILRLFISVILIGKIEDVRLAIIMTVIGYVWFIGTLKLDLKWNIFVFIVLLFGFVYDLFISERNKAILADKNLSEEDKKKIIKHHSNSRLCLVMSLIGITLIGTVIYAIRKRTQYKDEFNLITFLKSRPK